VSKLGFNLIYNFEIGNDIERERGKYYTIQNKYINKYSLSILVCSICTFNLSTSSQQYLNSNWDSKIKKENRKEKEKREDCSWAANLASGPLAHSFRTAHYRSHTPAGASQHVGPTGNSPSRIPRTSRRALAVPVTPPVIHLTRATQSLSLPGEARQFNPLNHPREGYGRACGATISAGLAQVRFFLGI
jgi:hypothetical protein